MHLQSETVKVLEHEVDPVTISFLVSKANALSSTYSIQKISKRVPWENVFAGWLVILSKD